MATVTVTITAGKETDQAGTPTFWSPIVSAGALPGGQANKVNTQVTVQFADSVAQTNLVQVVGTYEQIADWAKSILKAISMN